VRVLVVSAPLLGHLLPLVPLAAALRSAGHEVLIATGAAALDADTRGVPVRDIAPGFRFDRIALRTMIRHPLIARAEMAGSAGTRVVGLVFGAANDRFVDAAVELAREWRPDVVVHEPLAPAGAVAAAAVGAPAVHVENALFPGPAVAAAVVERMGRALRRHGLAALLQPALVVTVRPPSLGGSPAFRPMRPGPAAADGAPEWLLRPGERPRILVSRSTVAGPGGGDPMPAVVAAAADVDAEIVLVRPGPRLRSPLPPNVRTVGWVPLPAVLPHATAVVHHGGAGSVLAACTAGIPQLATPGPGDRAYNAELVAGAGAGLAVPDRRIDAAALTRLVTDEGLAEGARKIAAEIAGMPLPEELVPELTALVHRGS
jgi:UDP:flavonoid glycosyltransferase YjiC (YdhE family)